MVANTGNTATTYSYNDTAPTEIYTYRISAINSIGTGSSSSVASATTPIAAPSPPIALTASASSSSQIALSWTAPSDNGGSSITGYKIDQKSARLNSRPRKISYSVFSSNN